MQNFLELQCLVDIYLLFRRNINVYQCSFTSNVLCDEVDRGLGHEKNILLDTIYIVFFLKTVISDLN